MIRNDNKRKVILSEDEVQNILSGKMLTANSINLAQNLLSAQFPWYEGLQHTIVVKENGFKPVTPTSPYIQILHSHDKTHWVCVANTAKTKQDNQDHNVYDSYRGLSLGMHSGKPEAIKIYIIYFPDKFQTQIISLSDH